MSSPATPAPPPPSSLTAAELRYIISVLTHLVAGITSSRTTGTPLLTPEQRIAAIEARMEQHVVNMHSVLAQLATVHEAAIHAAITAIAADAADHEYEYGLGGLDGTSDTIKGAKKTKRIRYALPPSAQAQTQDALMDDIEALLGAPSSSAGPSANDTLVVDGGNDTGQAKRGKVAIKINPAPEVPNRIVHDTVSRLEELSRSTREGLSPGSAVRTTSPVSSLSPVTAAVGSASPVASAAPVRSGSPVVSTSPIPAPSASGLRSASASATQTSTAIFRFYARDRSPGPPPGYAPPDVPLSQLFNTFQAAQAPVAVSQAAGGSRMVRSPGFMNLALARLSLEDDDLPSYESLQHPTSVPSSNFYPDSDSEEHESLPLPSPPHAPFLPQESAPVITTASTNLPNSEIQGEAGYAYYSTDDEEGYYEHPAYKKVADGPPAVYHAVKDPVPYRSSGGASPDITDLVPREAHQGLVPAPLTIVKGSYARRMAAEADAAATAATDPVIKAVKIKERDDFIAEANRAAASAAATEDQSKEAKVKEAKSKKAKGQAKADAAIPSTAASHGDYGYYAPGAQHSGGDRSLAPIELELYPDQAALAAREALRRAERSAQRHMTPENGYGIAPLRVAGASQPQGPPGYGIAPLRVAGASQLQGPPGYTAGNQGRRSGTQSSRRSEDTMASARSSAGSHQGQHGQRASQGSQGSNVDVQNRGSGTQIARRSGNAPASARGSQRRGQAALPAIQNLAISTPPRQTNQASDRSSSSSFGFASPALMVNGAPAADMDALAAQVGRLGGEAAGKVVRRSPRVLRLWLERAGEEGPVENWAAEFGEWVEAQGRRID
ncbi:hypothetical protein EJ06DRAFT_579446 [Trichodelitschia bisporula]|uniref:Uncharacterized protein n=1 Tax=Trichodelitschia bisporula TaxID=703511 RepID=A0A6G1I5D1_9PEZI|nr:hypothetical protein EJ06DRAFT_579446 [Trichodelitschia bisporula]